MKTNSTDLEDFREFFHEADKKTEEKKRCGEKKMAKIVEKRQNVVVQFGSSSVLLPV